VHLRVAVRTAHDGARLDTYVAKSDSSLDAATSVPTRIAPLCRFIDAHPGRARLRHRLGIFLGDLVAPLHWIAEAYIKLLQMTVLPYVTVSISRRAGTAASR
jgi:hypothetical protein